MDELDRNLLKDLSQNSRLSYAELGRKYDLSRVCIRDRINSLVERGIIKNFTITVDPDKIGKKLSVIFEIEVLPNSLFSVAEELTRERQVTEVFLMTGSENLQIHTMFDNKEELELFLKNKLFNREGVLRVNSNIVLRKFKGNDMGL